MSSDSTQLVDQFGRSISYLRMSVTDRCDFRCVYCMDEEMTFVPRSEVLTLEEMQFIADVFVSLGVKKIRLTGGEPLVRANVEKLCEQLGRLNGLDELVMTTNGSQLPRLATKLRAAGVKRLNISLDTLKADRFKQLTRTGDLAKVLEGIEAAREAGFERIKLNAVIMKGRNDEEIEDLVAFAMDKGLDISFIEEMPLGEISEHSRAEVFMSNDEIKQRLLGRWSLTEIPGKSTDGPSQYYAISAPGVSVNDGADSEKSAKRSRVGFISPHSHNFCGDCNRVRLTAEGRLLLCLGHEHSMDLKAIVRQYPGDRERLSAAIIKALDLKPERHYFSLDQEPEVLRFMNMTGG